MKKLIIDKLLTNTEVPEIFLMVNKYLEIFDCLEIEAETVALYSKDLKLQIAFKLAALIKGLNYVIIDREIHSELDLQVLTSLEIRILFEDEESLTNILPSIVDNTNIVLVLNAFSCKAEVARSQWYAYAMKINKVLYNVQEEESNENLEYFKNKFKNYVNNSYRNSTFFAIHPSISTYGSKLSVFNEEILFNGVAKFLNTIYDEIKNTLHNNAKIDVGIMGNMTAPYVFTNAVLPALYSGGSITKYLPNIPLVSSNVLFASTELLLYYFETIIENSGLLNWLNKFPIFWPISMLFKSKFKRQLPKVEVIILYGKATDRLKKYVNTLNLKIIYLYTATEVASFISYEMYNKLPIKSPLTVGYLPKDLVLNTGFNKEDNAEILINLPDQFLHYTNTYFTQLCSMSEKYLGMHSTLDIGRNYKGKLQILGKAEEILINQNNLTIQTELLYSLLLSNRYIKDAIIISDENSQLIAIVELQISQLLYDEIDAEKVINDLNVSLLPKINSKVKRYSVLRRIILIPGGFVRINSKIKLSNYTTIDGMLKRSPR